MANTYVAIATVTVGSGGASTIEFTSIPATYNDLCLLLTARNASAGDSNIGLRFNADSGTNYSFRSLQGSGTAVSSENGSSQNMAKRAGVATGNAATASTFSNIQLYIPNYAGSTNKSFSMDSVSENNGNPAYATLAANLWSQTNAITSITLYVNESNTGNNFAQYSTATLYGIKNS
jgi:hypothetical protein